MTFPQYWAEFVRAHASPSVRRTHFLAVSAGLGWRLSWVLAGTAVAFVPAAWMAHRLDARGVLAAHPLFAAAASAKMWEMTLLGTMDAEVHRIIADEVEDHVVDGGDSVPPPNMVTDHTLH
jgi:hypothetical protein